MPAGPARSPIWPPDTPRFDLVADAATDDTHAMSLPPGFLDELRTRVTLSSVIGRKVTWDQRKSNAAKGDLWAPCPFHQEKTASFHVDDRKGYYYCFGCHAKGDAISFLKEVENMSFMEAVEDLAREAGMPMPARDPREAQKADRRSELAAVMEEAARHFRLALKTGAGAAARDYLAGRKLTGAALDRFEIGFAPDGWQGLWDHLRQKGIAEDLILGAGLARPSTKGKQPYDVFRNRIMFPIRDARGRCIAFGGRAMDPNDNAKYLNSPETELFDKGRSLYNHGPAREAAAKGQPLIVAEGYMDVIALVRAGFEGAVAPLGTAITEDQLRLIWRLHPEPLVMLDGDTAGIRAATRLIDLALPMLEAGQGLRFVILPEGMDPDDMIRARGREAMAKAIEAAQPMVNLLWRRETDGKVFDSPERKAALRKALRDSITTIRDKDIRRYYAEILRHFEWKELGPPAFEKRRGKSATRQRMVLEETKSSMLARDTVERAVEYMRETAIIAVCLTHPDAIPAFESGLERLEMIEPGHWKILQVILSNYASDDDGSLFLRVSDVVGRDQIEKIMGSAHIKVLPPIKNPGDYDLSHDTLAEQMAKLESERGLRREIEDAAEDMDGLVDEGLTWRLLKAAEARNRANRAAIDDDTDMGEDRAALSAELQRLIDGAAWIKKKP